MIPVGESAPTQTYKFALLHLAFRPFFIGAAAFSILATIIWMAFFALGATRDLNGLPPLIWHAHEMVYGYAFCVIAGFLLTAVKNWTNIQTVHGLPLLLIFLLWLCARLIPLAGSGAPMELMAALDVTFGVFLCVAITIPIVRAKNWIQMAIVSKVVLLVCGNLVFYLGVLGWLLDGVRWGIYIGLYLILSLLFNIGRRVIPFFIERGVGYPVELRNWKWLDLSSMALFLIFMVLDVFTLYLGLTALLAGVLFVLHMIRMWGWYTPGIWAKPLLWVLYVGYGFLICGFALKVAAYWLVVPSNLAVHAFAYGGIGMITLGMMARVSLGHTGRNMAEPPAILFWVFLILLIGAVLRVFVPIVDPDHYNTWIGLSQVLWITAFSMFLWKYFPMLIKPRIDGQYG